MTSTIYSGIFEYVRERNAWYQLIDFKRITVTESHVCSTLGIDHFGSFIKNTYNVQLSYDKQRGEGEAHLQCYVDAGPYEPPVYHNAFMDISDLGHMWVKHSALKYTPEPTTEKTI